MEKFQTVKSIVCPLDLRDVDTDMIIPAQFMTSVSREGYGEHLFKRLRESSQDFPLNQGKYKGAEILVAGENFGCGSSREHAVWALTSWGFKVVIAKSFADIFSSNSAKNGLLLITLPAAQIDLLLSAAQKDLLTLNIDLAQQKIFSADGSFEVAFEYDPFRKHCLLGGLDDLDYILSKSADIEKFRQGQVRYFDTRSASVASSAIKNEVN